MTAPKIVSLLFCFIAGVLMISALAFPSRDGGEWFVAFYLYWPVSYLNVASRELLKTWFGPSIQSSTTHHFSLLNIYDAGCLLILGTAWYYFLTAMIMRISKAINVRIRKSGARK